MTIKIRTSVLILLCYCLASFKLNAGNENKAMVTIDFETSFPYIFWVSTWSKDEAYPDGFRYKVLSSWAPNSDTVETVLLIQGTDYSKQEMKRWESDSKSILNLLNNFLPSLEKEFEIEFEKQDYSKVRTYEAFKKLAEENGWQ